jgi:hypothetical protein
MNEFVIASRTRQAVLKSEIRFVQNKVQYQ